MSASSADGAGGGGGGGGGAGDEPMTKRAKYDDGRIGVLLINVVPMVQSKNFYLMTFTPRGLFRLENCESFDIDVMKLCAYSRGNIFVTFGREDTYTQ